VHCCEALNYQVSDRLQLCSAAKQHIAIYLTHRQASSTLSKIFAGIVVRCIFDAWPSYFIPVKLSATRGSARSGVVPARLPITKSSGTSHWARSLSLTQASPPFPLINGKLRFGLKMRVRFCRHILIVPGSEFTMSSHHFVHHSILRRWDSETELACWRC
jgi:hypothetical protein